MASRIISPPSVQLLRILRFRASLSPTIHPRRSAHHASRSLCPSGRLPPHHRPLSTTSRLATPFPSTLPRTSDRGPKSTEDTVTDFGSMDVLSATPPPTTTIDACLHDGFHFGNGLKISGGSGCLLVGGEAFSWRPWEGRADRKKSMLNDKGQWSAEGDAWGLLDLIWPKPGQLVPFSPAFWSIEVH